MRNSKGQFVKVTHTVLRPSTRGMKSRGLSMTRQQVRSKRKHFHLSDCPRPL